MATPLLLMTEGVSAAWSSDHRGRVEEMLRMRRVGCLEVWTGFEGGFNCVKTFKRNGRYWSLIMTELILDSNK
jgi:hypothetical protein